MRSIRTPSLFLVVLFFAGITEASNSAPAFGWPWQAAMRSHEMPLTLRAGDGHKMGLGLLRYSLDFSDLRINEPAMDEDAASPYLVFSVGRANKLLRLYVSGAPGKASQHGDGERVWILALSRLSGDQAKKAWQVVLVNRSKGSKTPKGTLARFLSKFVWPDHPYGLTVGNQAPEEAKKMWAQTAEGYACYQTIGATSSVRCFVILKAGNVSTVEMHDWTSAGLIKDGYPITKVERELLAKTPKSGSS